MTPLSILSTINKLFPKQYTIAVYIVLTSSYCIIDHYVYDLTPGVMVKDFLKFSRMEAKLNIILANTLNTKGCQVDIDDTNQ